MKYLIIGLMMCACLVSGCGSITSTKKQAKLNADKLLTVGQLSYGIDYSLQKTNLPAVKKLNDNILNVTGLPTVSKQEEVKQAVDTTNYVTIIKEVVRIEKVEAEINQQLLRDSEQLKVVQEELADNRRWFGLKGVFNGLRRFSWWLLGAGVVFVVLRIAATANPIASAIFGIFENIGAMFIRAIGYIIPKSLTTVKTAGEGALKKIVDAVEYNELLTPEVKQDLSEKMTDEEKRLIKEVKKSLLYK